MTFYNERIEPPQSAYNNSMFWELSTIGRLNQQTEGQVYLKEVPYNQRGSMYAWKIVDAYWSSEDTTMTRFRAYDLDGKPAPFACFGVTWAGNEARISGGFKYPPEAGNSYYVPIDNQMNTPNSGGYTVVVLDTEYPTEGLAFGCYKQGDKHQALVVVFRLCTINAASYPNDVEVK